MPYLKTSGGLNWHYAIKGDGDAVLFLHGWGVNMKIWCQQFEYFPQNYKVITVDLPGHGQSSWKDLSLKEMVDDLNDVLENLDLKDLNLVGSSFGGLFVLKLFELVPGKLKRLAFVGSLPRFVETEQYPHGLRLEQIRQLKEQVETNYPSVVNVFFRSLFTTQEREGERFQWLQKFKRDDEVPQKQALIKFLDILEVENLIGVLKNVHCPVQIINGTQDYICSQESVYFLKKNLAKCRINFLDNCGHFPFLTKPQEFNRILESFLKS